MYQSPRPISEAKRSLATRGFGTFKHWARANRKGVALHRQRKNPKLVSALETEYMTMIRPNL